MTEVICPQPGQQLTIGSITFAPRDGMPAHTVTFKCKHDAARFTAAAAVPVRAITCIECEIERRMAAKETPLSRRIQFDDENDRFIIDGFKVGAEVVSEFTKETRPGRWFRIVKREGGVITIETKQEEV